MPDKNALDLSSIDPPIWRIMVEEVVYGPYTFGQLQTFTDEGRLSETSKVANGDGGAFSLSREHAELMPFFQARPDAPKPEQNTELSNYFITVQADGDGRRTARRSGCHSARRNA